MDNQKNTINPSERDKYKDDKALAKKLVKTYCMGSRSAEDRERLYENLELHAGRWEAVEKLGTGQQISIKGEGEEVETFTIGDYKVRHYDKIGRITRGKHGEFINSEMVCIIKDISSKAKSIRDNLKLTAVKDALYEKYVAPKIDLITRDEMIKNNIPNILELQPEQQQEFQTIVNQRVIKESPEEIMSALEKTRTPDEQVCNIMMNYTIKKDKLKKKYDQGALFAIANGEEYYRPYISNNVVPKLDVLIPSGVTWGKSSHIEMVEDGTYAVYKQGLALEDVISRFGVSFLKGDLDKLDKYYNPNYMMGGRGSFTSDRQDMAAVTYINDDPELRHKNYLTRDGQQILAAVYERVGDKIKAFEIPHHYCTFRWSARAKLVTRLVNGKKKDYIFMGHYVKNPRTDISVQNIMIPQVWESDLLADDTFINLRSMEYQYDNIYNPWDVKLGIFGGQYNTVLGTTKNYSLIDNGKIWNYKYNVAMSKKEEIESTSWGKLLLLKVNAKPKGVRMEDWLTGLLNNKIGIVASNTEFGLSPDEKRVFDTVDLSTLQDSMNLITELNYYESELNKTMYHSDAKAGILSQYATNENLQQQIEASNLQMMEFFNRHREIQTAVNHKVLKYTLLAYKDNEEVKSALLDDFLKAHYEINMSPEDICQYELTIVDTQSELINVKRMQDLSLSFIQTGIISMKALSRLFDAKTMTEVQDIIDEAEEQRNKDKEKEFANQKEIASQNKQYQDELLKLKQDFDALQKDLDRKLKIDLAEINSRLLANANDIDGDKVNDSVAKAIAQIESNEKIKTQELSSKEKMKMAELAAMQRIAEINSRNKKM